MYALEDKGELDALLGLASDSAEGDAPLDDEQANEKQGSVA
jgi:hypothetical protein